MLDSLAAHNSQLRQFKGFLHAQVATNGKSMAGRVAWAAAAPDRIRLEWLNPLGQPVTSMAGNGETVSLFSYADQKRYNLKQTPTVLDKIIHIPIGIAELLNLLSGRPLIPDFQAVQEIDDPVGGYGIRLKNRWRRTLAEVYLTPEGGLAEESVYDDEGNLLYHIQWQHWQVISQYTVPRRFSVTTASGDSMEISIDRFIPDLELPVSTFELQPDRQAW